MEYLPIMLVETFGGFANCSILLIELYSHCLKKIDNCDLLKNE